MRGAVGAEEELRIAGRRSLDERLAVAFALQDGQAVEVRAQASLEHRAAVQQEMLRRDRRADPGACRAHELDAGARRHVLEHDPQARMALDERGELALDEDALAVEGIHVVARDLAVQLQHDVPLLHALEHGLAARERGDAGIRMRRAACGVALHAVDESARRRAIDLGGLRRFRQVERHERFE